MKSKKVLTILLSLAIMVTFMPTFAFAANEKASGGHKFNNVAFENIETVAAGTDGLEVLVEPTCTTEGVGVIACDEELNGEPCGFTRTVKIPATGHTAGEMVRVTAIDVMQHIGYNQDRIDYFFERNGGAYAYCQCYVYVCEDCGEYVDGQGRKVNAMWTNGNNPNPAGTVVCPVSANRVTEHTKPANTPNCQAKYTCEVCGYEECANDKYSALYHDPNNDGALTDKDLTVKKNNVHIEGNNVYVTVTEWKCNLCGETGKVYNAVGKAIDGFTHSNTTQVVTEEPTCTQAGKYSVVCNDCGYETGYAPIPVLAHEYETVTPYEWTAEDKYADGTAVAEPAAGYEYAAQVCKNCGRIKKDSIVKVGYPEAEANAEVSYSELTKATCEQGSWIKVTTKLGDETIERYWTDVYALSQIEKIGDKYYLKGGTHPEVPFTPALKHSFGDLVKVAEATCEKPELEGKVCSNCGNVDHNDGIHAKGKALGHDTTTVTVAPTCGAVGYTYSTCSRCKLYVKKDGTTTADFDAAKYDTVEPVVSLGAECKFEWKVTKAATETEDGEKALVCSVCGTVKDGSQTVIPADVATAEKKAAAEAALPVIEAAADIIDNSAAYTAKSVAAVEEAKSMLNSAIASGTAADVKAMTENLQKVTAAAEKKAENDVTAKNKTVTVKANKKTKKVAKNKTFKKAAKASNAAGKVTFKKANKAGGSKIVVKSNGNVVVKKGLKKGTYKVKFTATAAGNGTTLAGTSTGTVTVKVK